MLEGAPQDANGHVSLQRVVTLREAANLPAWGRERQQRRRAFDANRESAERGCCNGGGGGDDQQWGHGRVEHLAADGDVLRYGGVRPKIARVCRAVAVVTAVVAAAPVGNGVPARAAAAAALSIVRVVGLAVGGAAANAAVAAAEHKALLPALGGRRGGGRRLCRQQRAVRKRHTGHCRRRAARAWPQPHRNRLGGVEGRRQLRLALHIRTVEG